MGLSERGGIVCVCVGQLVQRTIQPCKSCLKDAAVEKKDINEVRPRHIIQIEGWKAVWHAGLNPNSGHGRVSCGIAW